LNLQDYATERAAWIGAGVTLSDR